MKANNGSRDPGITIPVSQAPAAWLTLVYLTLSVAWILMSDTLAQQIAGDDARLLDKIQAVKGIFFVAISGALIYWVSRKLHRGIRVFQLQKLSIEKKFSALNEAAREGIFDYDIHSDKARLNDKMKFFFPAGAQTISGFWEMYRNRVHPGDVNRLEDEFRQITDSAKTAWQTELRLLGSDNKYYNVISSSYVIRHPGTGFPDQVIGTVLDVSDLRNLQAENYEQKLKHKKTLAASIIRAQENERNRWAQELHDNVCQILAVANIYAGDIIKNPGQAVQTGAEIQKLVCQSLSEIRQLSASIKTHTFTTETLQAAIEKLVANINRVNHFDFELSANGFDELKLNPEQKLLIYRVIQEQLNNIMKYAGASKVNVELAIKNDETAEVVICDNGKGFDPAKVKSGIGLQNIRSRLQIYGGTMQIDSSPGGGCRLQADFRFSDT